MDSMEKSIEVKFLIVIRQSLWLDNYCLQRELQIFQIFAINLDRRVTQMENKKVNVTTNEK